jgi:hypothetical protein
MPTHHHEIVTACRQPLTQRYDEGDHLRAAATHPRLCTASSEAPSEVAIESARSFGMPKHGHPNPTGRA